MSGILNFRTCCKGFLFGEEHRQEGPNWHGDMYLRNKIKSQDCGLRNRKGSQHRGDRDTHTRVGQHEKKRLRKGKNKIVAAPDLKPLPFQLVNPSKVAARTKVEERKTIAFATATLHSPKIRVIKSPRVVFTYQQPMKHSHSELTFSPSQPLPCPPSPCPSPHSTPPLHLSPFHSRPSVQIEAVQLKRVMNPMICRKRDIEGASTRNNSSVLSSQKLSFSPFSPINSAFHSRKASENETCISQGKREFSKFNSPPQQIIKIIEEPNNYFSKESDSVQIIEDLEPIAKATTYKKVRYLDKEEEIEVVRKSLMLAGRRMTCVESEAMSISQFRTDKIMFDKQESYFEKSSDQDLGILALRLKFKKEKSREKSKGKKKDKDKDNLPSIKLMKEENYVRSGRRHLTNVREPKSIGEIHFRTIETILSSSEEQEQNSSVDLKFMKNLSGKRKLSKLH